jgi:membrane protein DedA with SNARE-associated domain/rhodanese-related sulfurtransferase
MTEIFDFLTRHGPSVLFLAVFVEQMGVPLPASPWLLAAGALGVSGKPHWYSALAAGASGSMLADIIWFYLGRYKGQSVLNFLCRVSLEPDSCVRRTQDLFTRYGMRGVIAAKFIPGLSTLAPPMAGNSGIKAPRFFFFDGLGSLLYTGVFILAGAVFNRQLDQVINALDRLGLGALALVIGLLGLYLGYKYYQRQRLLKQLRMARITVDELFKKLETGENVTILDLRSSAEVERNPLLIRSARHMTLDELKSRQQEIPRDRDIILYCSCPNEVTAARMALLLQRSGFTHVRPLLGGIDAWRERNYPTEMRALVANLPSVNSADEKLTPITTESS